MRIIRVEHGGTSYYGILEDGLVFRLHQQPGHMEPIPLSEAKVLPLVTPSKVVCVGLNYKAHAEELGYPLPNMPSFFLKPPSSIIGNGEPIVLPSGMGRIEHEAELAMVVGKVCRNLTPEEHAFFMKRYEGGVPEDQVAALIAQYQAPAEVNQPMRAAGGLRAV